MIAVINTGGANLASVTNALDRLQTPWTLTCDAGAIQAASRVILPGVGAASDSMSQLEAARLTGVIKSLTQPVLGICLGMQLLFEHSEEGDTKCLGIIPGTVSTMAPEPGLRIPHMGWNLVTPRDRAEPLWAGLPGPVHLYFVHSYAAPMGDWVCATAVHGKPLPAVVRWQNFVGCQFHPERSGRDGARILGNFVERDQP